MDDFVAAVAARVADVTVLFEAGKLRINEHAQRRKAIFVRQAGVLKFTAAPGRQLSGIPVGGVGVTELQRFAREERIEMTLSAEDESELDELFDAVVNAIYDVGGPNVFENENPYRWAGEDSQRAGKHLSRNPEIKFTFNIRLVSHPKTKPYAVLAATQSTLTEPPGQPVQINKP
jgi:hypothetical protein